MLEFYIFYCWFFISLWKILGVVFIVKLYTFVTVLSFQVSKEHTDCTLSHGKSLMYRVFQEEHFSLKFIYQFY